MNLTELLKTFFQGGQPTDSSWLKPEPTVRTTGLMSGATFNDAPPTQQQITMASETAPQAKTQTPTQPPTEAEVGAALRDPASNIKTFQNYQTNKSADIQALLDQLNAQGGRSVDAQRRGLGDQEALLKNYLDNVKPGVDLSPLMALADTWYGGNLAKGYKAPISGQDIMNTQRGLMGDAQKSRLGVTEAEGDRLKQELMGRLKLRELEAMELEKRLKRETLQDLTNKNKDYKEDKFTYEQRRNFTKDYGETLNAMADVNTDAIGIKRILAASDGVPVVNSELLSRAASLASFYNQSRAKLGALSGPDKSMIDNALMVSNEISGMFANRLKGTSKEKIIAKMEELININDQVMKTIDKQQKILSPVTQPVMDEYLNNYNQRKIMAGGVSSTTTDKPVDKMTDDEVRAAYNAKFGVTN
jgi:hypothetical protein